ncbi:MAG TPA: hypothetical protein VMY05_02040 [Acidobacteriota bacterium]|nr:hypothetical protein [Acidobacteriota bacterium]
MIHRFRYTEAVLEFCKNEGRACLHASDPNAAIAATRDLFDPIRDVTVQRLDSGQYLVSFKASLDYRLNLVHLVERAVKMLRDQQMFSEARYIDRYIVATICMETGKPEWLAAGCADIEEEIGELRKAAIVAREVTNVRDFVDWDIAVYNYIELNSKEGHRSRVVRDVNTWGEM